MHFLKFLPKKCLFPAFTKEDDHKHDAFRSDKLFSYLVLSWWSNETAMFVLVAFSRHLVCTQMFLYWSLFFLQIGFTCLLIIAILSLCITFKDSATLLILTADGLWLSTPYIVLAPVQHANLNWFCLFDQLTHFTLKRTSMYKYIQIFINLFTISLRSMIHDSN